MLPNRDGGGLGRDGFGDDNPTHDLSDFYFGMIKCWTCGTSQLVLISTWKGEQNGEEEGKVEDLHCRIVESREVEGLD